MQDHHHSTGYIMNYNEYVHTIKIKTSIAILWKSTRLSNVT